ncbi:MAG: HDIG domain-containing protein, partial [Bacilli bacterium]|nr:HDIG domain-containing protein [Bacilli bacterium]
NNALFELGITKVDPELVVLIGKLHFRTSYGQNALRHSIEVANLAGLMASEIGENVVLAKRAGLLHDIGKAIDHEIEGSHVDIGSDIAHKYKENETVINAIESHHGDTAATSMISSIVAIADALSASRPGARNDSLENYVKRLQELENIARDVKGVEKTFAVQAGRELRVIVKPNEVNDLESFKIARDIKKKIEDNLQYPGTIKVTVIRETRAVEEAK